MSDYENKVLEYRDAQWVCKYLYDKAERELTDARAEVARKLFDRAMSALKELTAQVRGECPQLLNEDSGGDARLDMELHELFKLSCPVAEAGKVAK
jgi:hypothetical protein